MSTTAFELLPLGASLRRGSLAPTLQRARPIDAFDLAKAMRLNRCMQEWLGWMAYRQELHAALGFPSTCPTEAALADAVRRWQHAHGLTPDGILGLHTLNSLHARIGRPALTAEPARPAWFRWDPSPNFSSREGSPVDTIVLHATGGGSVQGAMARFKSRKGEASAHFVILRNGAVLQLVELSHAAWHTSSRSTDIPHMNQRSVGIEIVSPGGLSRSSGPVRVCEDESGRGVAWTCKRSSRLEPLRPLADYYRRGAVERFVPFADAQYRSLIRLLRYLVSCIPTVRLITGHEHLHKWHGAGKAFKNRVDPGGQFDWTRIETGLAGAYGGALCHRFSRLSKGTNRLNPDWVTRCGALA